MIKINKKYNVASNGMKKIFIFAIAFTILFGPSVALNAAGLVPDCGKVVTSPDGKSSVMSNPCDFNKLIELVNNIINFLLFYLAAPLAALAICIAGARLLFSGGNSESVTKAKKIIKHVVVGYILALAAWLIIKTIFSVLGFKGETFLH